MAVAKDITGQLFTRLTVIGDGGRNKHGNLLVRARCIGGPDCVEGNEVIVQKSKLLSGHNRSCGCFQKEITRKINTKREATPEALRYQYVELKQYTSHLANLYQVGESTVSRWLKHSGIETRTRKDGSNLYISQNKDFVSQSCSENAKSQIKDGRLDMAHLRKLSHAAQAAKGYHGLRKASQRRSQLGNVWVKCLFCPNVFSKNKSRAKKFCCHEHSVAYRRANYVPNLPAYIVAGMKAASTSKSVAVDAAGGRP